MTRLVDGMVGGVVWVAYSVLIAVGLVVSPTRTVVALLTPSRGPS